MAKLKEYKIKKSIVLIIIIMSANNLFATSDIVDGWDTDLQQAKDDVKRLKKPMILFLPFIISQ